MRFSSTLAIAFAGTKNGNVVASSEGRNGECSIPVTLQKMYRSKTFRFIDNNFKSKKQTQKTILCSSSCSLPQRVGGNRSLPCKVVIGSARILPLLKHIGHARNCLRNQCQRMNNSFRVLTLTHSPFTTNGFALFVAAKYSFPSCYPEK